MQYSRIVFWSMFWLLAFSAALVQGGVNARSEMVTDRPDQTESSVVVPEGFFQLEMGWEGGLWELGLSGLDKLTSGGRFGPHFCGPGLVCRYGIIFPLAEIAHL